MRGTFMQLVGLARSDVPRVVAIVPDELKSGKGLWQRTKNAGKRAARKLKLSEYYLLFVCDEVRGGPHRPCCCLAAASWRAA